MVNIELQTKLSKLGYTNLWIDFCILTEEHLNKQLEFFNNSDDKNTEHYRYATFMQYLTSKGSLTDTELDNYLKLVCSAKDSIMTGSVIANFLARISLT